MSPPIPNLLSVQASILTSNRLANITQGLLGALPSRSDIEILLREVSQSNYRFSCLRQNETTQTELLLLALSEPDVHPVLLARQMLLVATALQHIPRKQVIADLTEHHHIAMEKLAEAAISLVTTNDTLLGTLEGLENIILEALFHIDSGNIRRAWMTIRRAVMTAQLLGLHQGGQHRCKIINDQNDPDAGAMWACIVPIERFLSLLLGLPSSIPPPSTRTSTKQQTLPTLVMDVAASILARNEIRDPQLALDMTRQIDRDLIEMTEQLPSSFWRPSTLASLKSDSQEALREIRRTWDLMCYFTLLNQLHLPHMLYSCDASQVMYSRIACVNASREVLTRQIAMRSYSSVSSCCRMGDFMALIAGMTLILAHFASHSDNGTHNLLAHQRAGDRATVERALECMKSMSEIFEDMLAAKCVALLKHLLAVEASCYARGKIHSHQRPSENDGDHDKSNVLVIQIPYVGAVRIAREGITSLAPSKGSHPRMFHDGVTIGGLGSLHVSEPRRHSDQRDGGQRRSDQVSQPASAGSTVDTLSGGQQIPDNAQQVSPEDVFIQEQHEIFPDASASLDDWAFQGFDTVFFDMLMRGSGDQPPLNSAAAGTWDFETMA
ncbi:hypothetical protein FOPE_02519 [Fonsecaea pedrosoi]|nr:hypothetical protein FOPE_02519 [Fonsecaea pedrosoi]